MGIKNAEFYSDFESFEIIAKSSFIHRNFFKKVKITAFYYCTRLRKNLRNLRNAAQEWRNV